jgi:xylulokinase
MSGILILDVGTSALKAVLFNPNGTVAASADAGYGEPLAPHRQDPNAWWRAACDAVRALGPIQPNAIGLSGTMENLIPVDGEGAPVGPAILYSDPCGAPYLARAAGNLAAIDAPRLLGNPPEPLMSAFKLQWLADHDPAVHAAARWFLLSAKDALALRMTGVAATDPISASTSGLMGMRTRDWSPTLFAALAIEQSRLPPIRPSGAILGPLSAQAAAELGLPQGLPVINGCGDAGATTVGSACAEEGDVSLYLGTSGWVARVVSDARIAEPRPVYRLAHPADGLTIEITPILSAGAATAWARATLSLDTAAAEALLAEADRNPPDLVFLPYLIGERSPFADPDVRGAFIGLSADHGPAALYYAVLEGVSFAIAANLADLASEPNLRIRLAGGGATSRLWPQILADILGRPVGVPADPALATAHGAFSIAATALGWPDHAQSAVTLITPRPDRQPRANHLSTIFQHATTFARSVGQRLSAR